jgi:hypothetical protein
MTACQPLTESFIVLDTWDQHDGAYLHISSCQKFDITGLIAPAREFALGVDFMGRCETLSLDAPMHDGSASDPRFDPVEG